MRTDLLADARVLRIVSITRVDRMRVIGALYWLWSTAQTQSTDGVIQCLNEDIIDDQVSLPGFAKAAVAVGWLVLGDDTATVPDFDSYFGRSAKTRAKERLKKARQRWSKPPNATDTGEGQTGDKEGTQSGQHRDTSEQRIGSDRIGLDRIGSEPTPSEQTPVVVVEDSRKGKPEDPKYAALIFAGVGTGKARELAALPYFTLDSIRRVADSWKQQGKHPNGAMVKAFETAAEKDRIYADRRREAQARSTA